MAKEEEKTELLGIQNMIEFYSCPFLLKRAVCFLIMLLKKILDPGKLIAKGRITKEELDKAERVIIITVQNHFFPELMQKISGGILW